MKSLFHLLILCWLSSFISCQSNKDQTILIPDEEVSIFDLVEDIQFLRLGHPSQEESLFSSIHNAYFLDSFIVCGQNGIDFSDHAQYEYFDYHGRFLRRFSANNVLKEGFFFTSRFYTDNNGLYITDEVRDQTYHINHHGQLIEQFKPINRAAIYIPLSKDIILYSYMRDKPMDLLDKDDYYNFFLYSNDQQLIIEKGSRDVAENLRVSLGGFQYNFSRNQKLYHYEDHSPKYIVNIIDKTGIREIDRLTFSEGMIVEENIPLLKNGRPDLKYYMSELLIYDIFALQQVDDSLYGLIRRGANINYVFKKNLRNGSSQATRINWQGMVGDNFIGRTKIIDYSKDGYLATFSPAFNFKPFLDANKEMLEPHLINDFSDFSYSDNDVIILIKFKPEYYQM